MRVVLDISAFKALYQVNENHIQTTQSKFIIQAAAHCIHSVKAGATIFHLGQAVKTVEMCRIKQMCFFFCFVFTVHLISMHETGERCKQQ